MEGRTESFARQENQRTDRTYIGQMLDIERDYFKRQEDLEQGEELFRLSVAQFLDSIAADFHQFVMLKTESARRDDAWLALEERNTRAREAEVDLKRHKLQLYES